VTPRKPHFNARPGNANNPVGHARNLVAVHPGNVSRLSHGVYSRRRFPLTAEEEEELEALLSLPHTSALDAAAAEEIVRLRSLIARVDQALAAPPGLERRGRMRELVAIRARLSAQLAAWLDRFGLTPRARAEFARTLGTTSLAEEIQRRMNGDGP
jgi:hypothetical protein